MKSKDNKKQNFLSTYGKFILLDFFLLAILITLLVLLGINSNVINVIDNSVFDFINIFRVPFVTNLALFITYFGETITIILLLIICLIIYKKESLPLVFSTGTSAVINYLIKHIVKRPRPAGQFVTNLIIDYPFPDGYSFPSGHSQTGLVFYYFLAYLLLSKYYKGKNKKLFLGLSLIFPILIMLSRLVLGVHYFTDILCGATLGSLIIVNYFLITKIYNNKKEII